MEVDVTGELEALFLCFKARVGAMDLKLNHIYLVGVVIPAVLNDPSPAKTATVLGPLQTVNVGASTNPKRIRRHFCVILQYDPPTKIGVMLLGTSRPRQPHRFVPCKGTMRLPYQPRHEVCLSPPGGLLSTGYFNFTHALRATIIMQGDAILPILPQAFLMEKYADGTNIDVFLNPSEVEGLKVLHGKYWEGLRYNSDGSLIVEGGEGLGGNLGSGGSGGGGGAAGGGGVEGVGGSAPYFRPIGADGTISLPHPPTGEGGSGAERLARALLEEDERMAQLDLLAGDHSKLVAPDVFAFVEPLTVKALELVDSF